MNYIETIGMSFLYNLPLLIAWIAGIILGIQIVRRRGERIERLFLTGCVLMFTVQFIQPLLAGLTQWLISERGYNNIVIAGLTNSLVLYLLGICAMVCLVYAFWVLFRKKKTE